MAYVGVEAQRHSFFISILDRRPASRPPSLPLGNKGSGVYWRLLFITYNTQHSWYGHMTITALYGYGRQVQWRASGSSRFVPVLIIWLALLLVTTKYLRIQSIYTYVFWRSTASSGNNTWQLYGLKLNETSVYVRISVTMIQKNYCLF